MIALVLSATVAPAGAWAATLTVDPLTSCYRETQTTALVGAGFTPSGEVDIARDGDVLGQLISDPLGGFVGDLTLPVSFPERRS